MTNRKCSSCGLVNFATDDACRRCGLEMTNDGFPRTDALESSGEDQTAAPRGGRFLRRAAVTLGVAFCAVVALHASLLITSDAITPEQRMAVSRAISVLEERGFERDAWLLRRVVKFRQNDNWWNATVGHADAYAATNFPFEIVTLYPDFFTAPADDTERAAILLHEAQHLRGADEAKAFTTVWRECEQLGWTEEVYGTSRIWRGTAQLTREYAPELFVSTSAAVKPVD